METSCSLEVEHDVTAQFASPILVDDLQQPGSVRRLVRLRQAAQKDGSPLFKENFLQRV